VQLFGKIGEDKPVRDAELRLFVVAQRIVDVRAVPQIHDRVSAHVGQLLLAGLRLASAFQPQRSGDVPVRREVARDLTVDRAQRNVQVRVRNFPVRVVDHRDDHVNLRRCGSRGYWRA